MSRNTIKHSAILVYLTLFTFPAVGQLDLFDTRAALFKEAISHNDTDRLKVLVNDPYMLLNADFPDHIYPSSCGPLCSTPLAAALRVACKDNLRIVLAAGAKRVDFSRVVVPMTELQYIFELTQTTNNSSDCRTEWRSLTYFEDRFRLLLEFGFITAESVSLKNSAGKDAFDWLCLPPKPSMLSRAQLLKHEHQAFEFAITTLAELGGKSDTEKQACLDR